MFTYICGHTHIYINKIRQKKNPNKIKGQEVGIEAHALGNTWEEKQEDQLGL